MVSKFNTGLETAPPEDSCTNFSGVARVASLGGGKKVLARGRMQKCVARIREAKKMRSLKGNYGVN